MLPQGISLGNHVKELRCDPNDWRDEVHYAWALRAYSCYSGSYPPGTYLTEDVRQLSVYSGYSFNYHSVNIPWWGPSRARRG